MSKTNSVVLSALDSMLGLDGGICVSQIFILKKNSSETAFIIDENTKFGQTGPAGPTGPTGEVGPRGLIGNPGRPYMIGTTGGTQTGCCDKLNGWMNTYLIDTPPSFQYCPAVSQCDAVYFRWTYPTQINVGFVSSWLPKIQCFSALLFNNTTTTLINKNATEFVNNHDGTRYATALVLFKETGTNSFDFVQFPDGNYRYAYKIYNVTLQPTGNRLQIWYNNFSNQLPNKVCVPFDTWNCDPPVPCVPGTVGPCPPG